MRTLKYVLGCIAAMLLGFLLVGVVIPTVNYETKIEARGSAEHAWEIFTNDSNMSKWLPGFQSFEVISGAPHQVGSKFKMIMVEDGKRFEMIETLTAFEPNKLFAFTLDNEVLTNEVRIQFNENAMGNTEIVSTNSVKGKNMIFRSMFPFFKGTFTSASELSYQKLKDLIETTE